ncbi:MED7-domain-containing protein [Thozetella sp. PMI_491]|nr:MED7-domain-containing protein [Thozetella sp. PMI_491]
MADPQEQENKAALLFPNPPPFWQDFTPQNLDKYAALKQEFVKQHPEVVAEAKRASEIAGESQDGAAKNAPADDELAIRIPDVPPELVNLEPPAEPADGRWRLFGEQMTLHDELQSLEGAGIERLGPPSITNEDGKHADLALELKRLSKSLLLNFLEWMGTMSQDPQKGTEKIRDIKTLLLNFHHILNEYRPHQAREQLIALMQDQLDAKRKETQAIRSVVDKAKRMLEGLGSLDVPVDASMNGEPAADKITPEEKHWNRESNGWSTADDEFS